MQTATRKFEAPFITEIPRRVMSMREALAHGVTLDEAERRLDALIHNHYHPQQA